jgi:ribonuclease HI
MTYQSITVPERRLKIKREKQHKLKQGAIRIVTHGVSIPTNGNCAWLWDAFDDANKIASDCGERGDSYGLTSNSAKFHAVIEALGWLAVNMPDEPVTVLCDVEFIVKLVNGQNRTRKPHLNLLCGTAKQFLARTKATLEWMPHSQNMCAARLSGEACRKDFSKGERLSHDSI